MGHFNQAVVMGNLGKDPDFRVTPGGHPVANFTMATTEKWNDANGEKKEKTEWHNIVVWGSMAENVNHFLKKGSCVLVAGRLQTRGWEDKDGNRRYITEIVASNLQFVSNLKDVGAPAQAQGRPSAQEQPISEASPVDDDLPF